MRNKSIKEDWTKYEKGKEKNILSDLDDNSLRNKLFRTLKFFGRKIDLEDMVFRMI